MARQPIPRRSKPASASAVPSPLSPKERLRQFHLVVSERTIAFVQSWMALATAAWLGNWTVAVNAARPAPATRREVKRIR